MSKEPTITVREVLEEAYDLFETSKATAKWLTEPRRILGGDTPLEHARTHEGATDVIQLIGRIKHGVFS